MTRRPALDGPRRRLASLEPMILAYSIKVWYQHPPARTYHGADPNAPREPVRLDVEGRLAARVVDERLGGNPANLGRCDCPQCGCELRRPDGSYLNCEHDLACPHRGDEEGDRVLSERLRAFVDRLPRLSRAIRNGTDEVYALADLTPAETQVARYKHEGLSHRSIAFLTNRQEGTVFALYSRASWKLRQLADELREREEAA